MSEPAYFRSLGSIGPRLLAIEAFLDDLVRGQQAAARAAAMNGTSQYLYIPENPFEGARERLEAEDAPPPTDAPVARAAEQNSARPAGRYGSGAFAQSAAETIGTIAQGSAPQGFPLDAEQIVRLTASVVAVLANANRPAGIPERTEAGLLDLFARAAGLPLRRVTDGEGFQTIAPYGDIMPWPMPSSDPRDAGGSREP